MIPLRGPLARLVTCDDEATGANTNTIGPTLYHILVPTERRSEPFNEHHRAPDRSLGMNTSPFPCPKFS